MSSELALSLVERLLPYTIRNAAQKNFYRSLWGDARPETVAALVDLPTVTKSLFRAQFMNDPDCASGELISHSTGTSGEVTWRRRSHAEQQVIGSLFAQSGRAQALSPLAVSLVYTRHGMPMPIPSRARVIPCSLRDDIEVTQLLETLQRDHGQPRSPEFVTAVAGQAADVALLGQILLERGLAEVSGRIHCVSVSSNIAHDGAEIIVRAFPSAEVRQTYSLSEIFGGAGRSGLRGTYESDPYVIAEIVDDHDERVADGQVGELVLTEMFPFVQVQPLIRYRTGDLARLVEQSSPGRLRFEILGRRSNCLLGDCRLVLDETRLSDELSQEPLVRRYHHRPEITAVSYADFGGADFEVATDAAGRVIELSLVVHISPWTAEAERLAERASSALLRCIEVHQGSAPEIVVRMRAQLGARNSHAVDRRFTAVGE